MSSGTDRDAGTGFVARWRRKLRKFWLSSSDESLKRVREKFAFFLSILEANNRALRLIGDMEEKSQGEYLFDLSYVRSSVEEIRSSVRDIIENLILLGGDRYEVLRDRFAAIDGEVELMLGGQAPVVEDAFTISLGELRRDCAASVGSKNAQLGEMKSLGLRVPDGFAISAWAYKHFIDANDLQARISGLIDPLDIRRHEDLVRVGEAIRALVRQSPLPDDLAETIEGSVAGLADGSDAMRFAIRSSAIGEDTQLSFAGRYATYLEVEPGQVLDRYRDVLASKFTPQAIYYYLSHSLSEAELAMSVGCMEMVDAATSGVVYTRSPVSGSDDAVLVNAVFGLGKPLVDGSLTPDVFTVSRKDGSLIDSSVARKPFRLVRTPRGGTAKKDIPPREQDRRTLSGEQLNLLLDAALRIEDHYGCAQDIEWAIDRGGRLFLLQTRPLRTVTPGETMVEPDVPGGETLFARGTTVCPGAGGGPVFHADSPDDLPRVPEGSVLVAPHPFPGIITVMGRVSAIVTEVGGVASHMATIAREYEMPTIAGVDRASGLGAGRPVTVDATGGSIYAGIYPKLIEARRPEIGLVEDLPIFRIMESVLSRIGPLNLEHPGEPSFCPENCRTFHDITRYAHQRAIEEMFVMARGIEKKDRIGLRLKTDIPHPLHVLYLDRDLPEQGGRGAIPTDELGSEPMEAFWGGVEEEGWPPPVAPDLGGFVSVMMTHMTAGNRLEEASFVILSGEYMLLSLRMGYHFMSCEALCSDAPSKNYIRIQFKEGGASIDRRIRRVRLIVAVLTRLGFEASVTGDFLTANLTYTDLASSLATLRLIGRLTMMTKQLDMRLTDDGAAGWHTGDILERLGLAEAGGGER